MMGSGVSGDERRFGIFTTDLDLVVKSWDASLERLTGIAAADACGRALRDIVPDLENRVPIHLFREPLISGSAHVLAPALHKYLIPCAPLEPSSEFDRMQQRVVIGALRTDDAAVGLVVTVEDVTARLESERVLARRVRDGQVVDPVVAALADDDWQVRRTAVREMAARRDAALIDSVVGAIRDGHRNFGLLSSALQLLSLTGVDVTDALVSLMQHADSDVRIQAALALGTQRREKAIDALIAAFDDPDVNVRFHAIEAIGRLPHPGAIVRLADIATSGDFFLAFPAVEALVRINDPLAAPRLEPLLADEMMAATAAEALGWIGDEDAVPALVQALEASCPPVDAIAVALVRLHQRYRSLYAGASDIEDLVANGMSPTGVQRVLAALPSASGEALKALVTVVSWLRNEAVPPALARLLGSADVRHEVTEAFVRIAGSGVPVLVQQLQSDDCEIRRAAITALGRLGDRRATPELIALLGNEEARDVWVAVAGALAKLGDLRAFEALLARLGDADAAVRQAAIGALNSIGHPDMCGRIAALLDDTDPHLRESAVRVAGYFGYPECTDRLLARCLDEDEAVRVAALDHLPYCDDDRAAATLASALTGDTAPARAAAARALGAIATPATQPLLLRALQDEDSWVRYFAVTGLGEQRDRATLPALADLARRDHAGHVAIAAVKALGLLGSDEAVDLLTAFAAVPDDRGLTAISVLGAMSSARALEPITRTLRSSDAGHRLTAIEALTNHRSHGAVDALTWAATADADPNVARAAVEALGAIARHSGGAGDRAVHALVSVLREPARKGDCVDVLAKLAAQRIPDLIAALNADDPHIRRGVVEALSRVAHPAASACLRRALSDGDEVVRRVAITALARIGTRGLGRQLALMAESDPSPAVRETAVAALRRVRSREGNE